MDSQNGLPNPLLTELQPHPLVQPNIFTVDSQKQQPTSLFSVDEQLIEKTIDTANSWKVVTELFPIVTVPNSFGEGVVNSWLTSANAPNPVTISDPALLHSFFSKSPTSAPISIAQYPAATIGLSKDLAISQIQAFLNRPDRLEQFKIAFGQDVERSTIDKIIGDWQKQNTKLPDIEILSAQILGKADGGFDTVNNKIYLARNLIERGNLAEIVPVIIEEFGHYLDSKIHPGGDAAGDEGEIFSKLVRGLSISAGEYVTLIKEDDHATIILNKTPTVIEQAVSAAYAIKAEKTVSFNGSSDLDGNPLDLSDDALVYGGKGFTFNGNSILPVKYDASGNPLKNSQGKLVLVDNAVTVTAGYLQANVNGTGTKYAGLTPPQIVTAETVIVPLFADIKQQELNRKIPAGTTTTTFNISTNPINTAAQWATKFPPAGTATVPKVVRVTGGGLNIPGTVNLSNYVIIVDSGDINFNGTGNLSNVTLVASNGNINLNAIQSDNLSALASGTINHNSSARFGGNSLFANGTGNITFNGATKGITANDNLWVISAGNITFNGSQSTRGSFVAQGDFTANGSTNLYGTVSSKQNIIFNGALNFTYANIRNYSDNNPPVILAGLVNDSGTSNSDKITNDGRISGTVTDASQIVAFTAGFNSKPVANFTDVLPYLTNGSFSFTKSQLETIYGGTIPDGSHTLNLIATDKYGNQSSVYPYTFTLDTITPVPTLILAATSDTGVVGDFRTKSALVTLTGKVEANAKVLLSGNPTPVTADSLGNYTFTNVPLTAGNNSFTVTATDIAGNQQTFTKIVYRTSPPTGVNLGTPQVLENSTNNTQVGGLNTTDPDGVDNYVYTLVNDAGGRFKLVGDKIQVANGSLLDFEATTQHQIQVRTTDGEGDSYLQTISISVLNVNESPNNLLVLPTVILENSPSNTIVGTITSTDPDAGDTFSYSLVAGTGDGDNAKFSISGDKLVIKNSPDYEAQSSYTIRLKTTDAGGLSYQKQVTISVTNVNEAPTSLTLSNTTFAENSGVNGIIGTFTSIDPDLGDTKTYTLINGLGDADNSQFTILGDKLQLKPNPDFETQSSYQLRARVTDAAGLSYDRSFIVNISDVNEAPTTINLSASTIAENSSDNSTIGILTTIDPDAIDTASYILTDNANGRFKLVGNELKVASGSLLDFEANTQHQITISSTDKGGLTLSRQFTIGVTNVNEIPIDLSLSNSTVAENTPLGGVIGNLNTIDPDLGDTHTYTLVNGTGSGDNSAFSIVNNQLKFLVSPNFETKSNYSLRVRTTDAGGLNIEKTLTVNITNVNEAPTQLVLDTTSVAENSPIGTLIGKFATTDPDLGDTHTYSLITGNGSGDNPKFSIAGNELRLNISPDFETQSVYRLRVQTKDAGGLTWEQELTVNILDLAENQAPTAIGLTNSSIAENSASNTLVARLNTTDLDLTDTHTYTLLNDAGGRFKLVGGELRVANGSLLDFETATSHQIRLRTTDNGTPNLAYERDITIGVTNVNETPIFTSNPIGSANSGQPYSYTITTTDPDTGDTRQIGTSLPLPSWLSLVDNGNGTATLSGNPGVSDTGFFKINLVVTDAGGLKSNQEFNLGVATTLVEGTSFNKRLEIPITIPVTGGRISFKLDPLQFDGTDLKGINDALEVALVDAQGKSLVTPFQTGRDAFFNWTEGENVVTGKGVSYTAATGIVTLDLTGVKPGSANLVFRLINNDSDTTTSVRLTDLTLSPNSPVNPNSQFSTLNSQLNPSPVPLTFFNSATDVSPSILADYHRTSFNATTKELDVNVALKNQGSYGLNGTLVVVVNHISDPSVQVKNADGFTPEGLAYYTFTTTNGKLDPNSITGEKTLVFRNPNGVQFSYDLTVLAELNTAPVIKSQPELEVIGGKNYQYQVKAEDVNGDSLTYKLLSAPSGMAIDPSTGLVTWNTSVGAIGNYQLSVEVSDGRGGIAEQNYNLAVITPPPNRPPVFTSTPVVDTAIGSVYSYQGIAKDPDGDSLIYSLTTAPSGMTVDANTGILTWIPTGSQLGTFDVSLGVADNRGGVAQQQFKIRTGATVDNHAPLIISDAVVDLNKIGGKIIVANDEWPLSNRGFQLAADTTNFVSNIANWFTGGKAGKFYAYSQNFGLADPLLAQTMRANGNTWTAGTSLPNNLAGLLQYDGIFVGEFSFDNNLLTEYVKAGGNVYTLAGTGIGGPAAEAGRWNSFLGNFGLAYDSSWNTILRGDVPTTVDSNHPLFKNVNSVYYSYGNGVRDLNSNDSSQKIIFKERETGNGLFGVYANPGQYQYQVKAIDVDNDRLTYLLDKAPTGMTIDANTGLITWRNNDWDWTEKLDVTVKVRDEQGSTDSQSFTLNLGNKKQPDGRISGAVYIDNGQPREQLVYFNDFENSTANLSEWSNPLIGTTPIGNRRFLGEYGGIVESLTNRQTSLSLNNLSTHDSVTVGFDLYLLKSWDGNLQAYYSPDRWKLKVRDGETLLDTSFMNSYLSNRQTLSQSYPDNYFASGTIQNPAFTGATEVETLGYNLYGAYRDSVYHLEYTFNHANPDLILDFIGGTDESIYNESWGIDNVKVSVGLPKKGVGGEKIYLDNNRNGQLDQGETSTLTDERGKYSFNLPTGSYTVAQVLPTGLIANTPTSGNYNVTVRRDQSIGGLDFANILDSSITQTPPEFLSTPLLTATIDRKYRYQAVAKDANFDLLTYDLVVKPDGMIIDSKTGVVTWLPTANQLGKTDAVIRVSDGNGGVDLQTFSINVTKPNLAPGFINDVPGFTFYTTAPEVVKVAAGDTYRFQFKGLDPDSDPISYRIKSFNSQAGNNINTLGVTIDANTGLLTWNTAGQALGFYSATVGVVDSKGAENIQTFTLELTNSITPAANLAPVIASTPRKQTAIGQTYVYQIAATDPNSDPLTYSLINPPVGMSVNTQGLLTWTPTAAQLGQSAIQIQVSDGRGGVTTQQFGLDVVSAGSIVNHSPEITSTPTFTTNLGKTYSYQPVGTDSDNDTLIWSLDNAPTGMVIDSNTGIVKWNPTSNQIGTHTIAVRLTDAYGLYVGQEYTLKVNGVNTPPQIQSSPNTIGGLNSPYKYQIKAIDLEGDALQYTLGRRPNGMMVDANTGLITWTPNSTQLGTQIIDVLVTDAQGAVATQTYNLVVGTTPINQAPSITSQPKFTADINTKYQYQIVATDPENQQLTYALTTAPAGMVIDTTTGLITWDNPTLGTTNIQITATDTSGAVAAQGYTLTGKQNQPPVINSTPKTQVTIGNTYRYDVIAKDPDNDALTYSLDTAALTAGVTIDKLGRITWKPTTTNIGVQPVTITVTDTIGAAVAQTYNLQVLADNTLPTINLVRGTNIANIGETISFQVQATDNVGIKSTQLLIDNQAVTLDSNGVGTYKVTTAGVLTAQAIVTDVNGNTSTANSTINIIDPTDIQAPTVKLDLSGIANGIITGRTDINGTVTDTNLDYYTLEVARFGTDNFKEVFRGTTNVTNGSLGKFDPSLLENDTYRVRLTAYDTGGRGSQIEDEIEVTGDLKLGNFRLSFTDLTIPVTGIPISLTRTYDSLTSGTTDDFGYGWRMEFRDTDLRTSLKADPYYEQLDYRTVGFNFGTRIYITLPGGKREGFTFEPKQIQGAVGGVLGGRLFYPSFVSDKGVTSTLTVPGADIKANTNVYSANAGTSSGNPNGVLLYKEGKLFNLAGRPYVPQDDGFGNRYLLTTKDGTVYEINATTGDLESVTDTNGNVLTYSDTEIKSSTGVKVTFERDNQGRITSVTDPLGAKVVYGYDAKGDLVSVKDRDGNETRFEYNAGRSHYLDKIVDPLGRAAVKTEYDEAGRLKKTKNSSGNGVEFVYNPANSLETVKDALGNATTYEYDKRGNVVTEVDANGGIIRRTYDDDTNMLSETDAEGSTKSYTYDSSKNRLTETDGLGNTTRYTYNQFGFVTQKVNALGQIIKYEYDAKGNQIATINAIGKTSSIFNASGQITSIIDDKGQTTKFVYDSSGHVTSKVDAIGHTTNYTYNGNGKLLTEVETILKNGIATVYSEKKWTYDSSGKVTSNTDALGRTVRYEYDSLGRQTAIVQESMNNRRTEYQYDERGNLTNTKLADGSSTSTTYDALNREISTTDALGRKAQTIYDKLGRVVEVILPDATPDDLTDNPRTKVEYDKVGRVVKSIDELGRFSEYKYDAAGRTTWMKDALGNKSDYTYSTTGRRLTETNALGQTTKYIYDDLSRFVATEFADGTRISNTFNAIGNRDSSTDQLGRITYYEYDKLNRLTSTILPDATPNDLTDNARTQTEYDELGRVIATIDENGNREEFDYDIAGQLIESRSDCRCRRKTYTYDNAGNKLSETDPLGHATVFVYDALDRLTQTNYTDGTNTKIVYDKLGQVIAQTNQMGNTTQFGYDERNRHTNTIDALGQRTEYTYDIIGNLTKIKDANLHTTSYEYDALNRRTATIIPLGQRSTTSYDAIGNMTTSTDFNGQTITYSYDPLNRLKTKQLGVNNSVSYTYIKTGRLSSTVDTRGITSYNYDQRDRLIKQTETDGQTLQYTYDKASNRTSITTQTGTTNYGYNRYNELTTVTDKNGGVTTYTYDKAGNRTKIQMADGTVETRSYDLLNHLIKQETSNSTGVIAGYTYTLDAGGKKVELLENSGRQVNYAYDKIDRLLTEQITDSTNGNRTTGYVYDAIGNRVSKTDSVAGVTSYVYDNNDRLLTETNGSKITTSTYDNNGNNLTRGDGTSLTTNTWDIEHRLIQSVTDASTTIYQYDANGVRVSSKTNGVETRYLVDSNRPHASVVMEYNASGTPITEYTYGLNLIAQERGGVKSFYHADGLGSTRFLTDSLGTVTDAYIYDAYGTTLSSSGTTVNNYLYTGEQFDRNLGEYYLRARYYNPSQGRFTGRDPFDGMLEEPLSLNKYAYVHGNPINNTDPTGMFAMSMGDISTALAIVGLLAAGTYASINIYNGVRSISGTAGNLGGSNNSSLPTKIKLVLLLSLLTSITITGDSESEDQTDLPIVFYGKISGTPDPNNSVVKHTAHIRDAIFSGMSPVLSAWDAKPEGHTKSNWYSKSTDEKVKELCGKDAKEAYQLNNGHQGSCDEYPFFSSKQGGKKNFKAGTVSLRLVPETESGAQSYLMNKGPNTLMGKAGVVPDDPDKQWYGVAPWPFVFLSYWRGRDGQRYS